MASFREQGPTERFEKRRLFRFPVQLPAQLGRVEDRSSICTNLSTNGGSFETSLPLQVSERIAVMVIISPEEEPLRMVGQVIWKRHLGSTDADAQPLSEIGVRFLRPLPSLERFESDNDEVPPPRFEEEDEDEYIFPRRT